jgi:hypothetical protein
VSDLRSGRIFNLYFVATPALPSCTNEVVSTMPVAAGSGVATFEPCASSGASGTNEYGRLVGITKAGGEIDLNEVSAGNGKRSSFADSLLAVCPGL